MQCSNCGETVKLYPTVADPLVLSMCGVLTAPFDLAIRVGGGAHPTHAFDVF
jgi:hypothetical protein